MLSIIYHYICPLLNQKDYSNVKWQWLDSDGLFINEAENKSEKHS